jgi:hypothetical protein
MTRLSWAVIFVSLFMVPEIAVADLSLQIGPQASPTTPDVTYPVSGSDGRQFFDLMFTETAPTVNEGLFAFALAVEVVRPVGRTGGLFLSGAARPPSDYVFEGTAGEDFTIVENGPDHMFIHIGSLSLVDITTGDQAARIFYTVDPGTDPGDFKIVYDTHLTAFASGDPDQPIAIPVALVDVGFVQIVAPEPSSLSLLCIAGSVGLLRPRAGRTRAGSH